MTRYVKLSHDLRNNTPLYPGTAPISIEPDKQLSLGDSCNTFVLRMSNHAGTHVDAPRHFYQEGKSIDQYDINSFVFQHPLVIDCPKEANELILEGDCSTVASYAHRESVDILFMKTGFQRYRDKDLQCYSSEGPCLSPDAAKWLISNLPGLRAVGIDCISIASHAHRSLGRETHRVLLGGSGARGNPVLIIEDMHMPEEVRCVDMVIISPLMVSGIDSAPCVVIGVTK